MNNLRLVIWCLSGFELRVRDYVLKGKCESGYPRSSVANVDVLCTGHVLAEFTEPADRDRLHAYCSGIMTDHECIHGFLLLACDPLSPALTNELALKFENSAQSLKTVQSASRAANLKERHAAYVAEALDQWKTKSALTEVRSLRHQWLAALDTAGNLMHIADRPLLVRFEGQYSHRSECSRIRLAFQDIGYSAHRASGDLARVMAAEANAVAAAQASSSGHQGQGNDQTPPGLMLVAEIDARRAHFTVSMVVAPLTTLVLVPFGFPRQRARPPNMRLLGQGLDVAQSSHLMSVSRNRCAVEPTNWSLLCKNHPLIVAADQGKTIDSAEAHRVFMASLDVNAGSGGPSSSSGVGQRESSPSTSSKINNNNISNNKNNNSDINNNDDHDNNTTGEGPSSPASNEPKRKKKRSARKGTEGLIDASKSDAVAVSFPADVGTGDATLSSVGSGGSGHQDDYNNDWESAEGPVRLQRAEAVLRARTRQLMVVLDRCYDSHNAQAVLRTCEALGVQHAWFVRPDKASSVSARAENFFHAKVTRGIDKFLTTRFFDSSQACIDALRQEGRTIWVADLLPSSERLDDITVADVQAAGEIALVIGRETDGVSAEFRSQLDRSIYLPTTGFVESLNLSVCAALMLQTVLRLMADAGVRHPLPDAEMRQVRETWFKELAGGRHSYQRYLDRPPQPLADLRRRPDANKAEAFHSRSIIHRRQIERVVDELLKDNK